MMFNFLLLNFALLITSVFVVTIPLALKASFVALDRWRRDGEDRVLREYLTALRSSPPLSTTAVIGAPLAATALGAVEVHYFLNVHNLGGQVCLGMGLAGLVVALTSLGYVLLVVVRDAPQPASDTWVLCMKLAVRNLFVTGPVFLLEIVGVTSLSLMDPAVVVFGSPLALIALMRLTANFGARCAGEAAMKAKAESGRRSLRRGGEDFPDGRTDHNLA
ncbi:MAG: hypothetical protein ACYCTE_02365 [Acidimicrobiales bacterium]